jgi:hypothetical protein
MKMGEGCLSFRVWKSIVVNVALFFWSCFQSEFSSPSTLTLPRYHGLKIFELPSAGGAESTQDQ